MLRPLALDIGGDETPEDLRDQVVVSATDLLADEGRDALTMEAVADASGVEASVLRRLFGDKRGLLHAIADRGLAFLAATEPVGTSEPSNDFRTGWDRVVAFGLANPALFAIIFGDPQPSRSVPVAEPDQTFLRHEVRGLAVAGLLGATEDRAVALSRAACIGAVLLLLRTPAEERDPGLATAAREVALEAIRRPAS